MVATLTVALLAITVANAVLGWRLRSTVPHELHRRLMGRSHAEVLAIGNSVVAAGFDEKIFGQVSEDTAVNAGLGAAGFAQQYVAWRLASDGRGDLKKVVLGTFDHSLTSYKPSHWTTWHSNNALPFYCDSSWSEGYGCRSFADRILFRIARHLPMFVERGGLWTSVEHLRRELGGIGLRRASHNKFGNIADFAFLLEQNEDRFREFSLNAIQTRAQLATPLADILGEARGKNIVTFVVMMPLPKARHRLYTSPEWRSYVEYLRGLLAQTYTSLIEATDWMDSPDDFEDSVHLSRKGAFKFTSRLAEKIE